MKNLRRSNCIATQIETFNFFDNVDYEIDNRSSRWSGQYLFWKSRQKYTKLCVLSLKMWQKRIYTHHEFPFLACAKKLSCGLKRKCWLGKMLYRKRAYIKNSFGKVNTIQWYDRFGNWRRKKFDKKGPFIFKWCSIKSPKAETFMICKGSNTIWQFHNQHHSG